MADHRLGGNSVYWVFPNSAARLSEIIYDFEINKLAFQIDSSKLYLLSQTTPSIIWTDVSAAPAGGGSLAAFEQGFASASSWTVNHNLGREPNIQVLNTGGSELIAEILHVSINQAIVYFASPQAGRVRAL